MSQVLSDKEAFGFIAQLGLRLSGAFSQSIGGSLEECSDEKKSKALKLIESNELFQESINSVPSQNFSQMDHMELIMPTLPLFWMLILDSMINEKTQRVKFLDKFKVAILDYIHIIVNRKFFEEEIPPILDLRFLKEEYTSETKIHQYSRDKAIYIANKTNEFAASLSSTFRNYSEIDSEEELEKINRLIIELLFYVALNKLNVLESEREMLKMMISRSNDPAKELQPVLNEGLKNFILTRNNGPRPVMSKYNEYSPATYSIEEFAEQLMQRNARDPNKPVPIKEAMEAVEISEQQENENYDAKTVYELRQKDKYWDWHKRGEGNRFNKG